MQVLQLVLTAIGHKRWWGGLIWEGALCRIVTFLGAASSPPARSSITGERREEEVPRGSDARSDYWLSSPLARVIGILSLEVQRHQYRSNSHSQRSNHCLDLITVTDRSPTIILVNPMTLLAHRLTLEYDLQWWGDGSGLYRLISTVTRCHPHSHCLSHIHSKCLPHSRGLHSSIQIQRILTLTAPIGEEHWLCFCIECLRSLSSCNTSTEGFICVLHLLALTRALYVTTCHRSHFSSTHVVVFQREFRATLIVQSSFSVRCFPVCPSNSKNCSLTHCQWWTEISLCTKTICHPLVYEIP